MFNKIIIICLISESLISIWSFSGIWFNFLFQAISINSVFLVFNVNLLTSSHFLTLRKSEFNLYSISAVDTLQNTLSLCRLQLHLCLSICSRQFGKLFMYIENSNGPRLDPCGTPHWIAFCSDFTLLSTQTCFLLFKYDLNSFWAVPFIPYCSSSAD